MTLIPDQPRPYCYNEQAKNAHSQNIRKVYCQAAKLLPGFAFKVHFNRGGIAVYGETYAKIYRDTCIPETVSLPVVEAYDTSMGLLIRQWDGKNSGANYYVHTLDAFVELVKQLASRPFVRF